MMIKNRLQLIKESIEAISQFKDGILSLMNKYTIEDSIFVYKNGQIFEATKGYFEIISEHDNLTSAMNHSNLNTGIRVIGNNKFEVGYIHHSLNECDESLRILDINSLNNMR